MLWVIVIVVLLGIVGYSFMNKTSKRLAERQVAAADPQGYAAYKAYEESQRPEVKARAAALLEQQRREAKNLLTAPLKPVDDAPIVLKAGEKAYWVEQCRYYEERSLLDLGVDRGMLEVDAGPLVLTNKRIAFVGQKRSIELPLSKVVAIRQLDGSMQINVANGRTRRLGTGNPRAEVIATRLLHGNVGGGHRTAVKAQATGNPITVNLSQSFNGPRDLIVETLESVAALLQGEVDKRSAQYNEQIVARPVDASTYLSAISGQLEELVTMFAEAEREFATVGSPKGSPRMMRAAYGHVLERLLAVRRISLEMDAPAMFSKTEAAYRDYVDSLYLQIADWPAQARKAAGGVKGESYHLELSATYDVAPLERAIGVESPA